jgi:hypothetical protein
MNLLRPTLLVFAGMAIFLVASLIYTMPQRPPSTRRAKADFVRVNPTCSVDLVEMHELKEDRISFWIRYRRFANNMLEDAVCSYRRENGKGWVLEKPPLP